MKNLYAHQNIAVLGLGESGAAAARLALAQGAKVTVLDSGQPGEKADELRGLGARLILGPAAERDAGDYDLIVLSPGIDPAVPLVRNLLDRGLSLTGELEFAYAVCACPVIAITGSNGKTTTTQLVDTMLRGRGWKTIAAGNISPAFSAVVEQTSELDYIVLEVSSFQLERLTTFRARVAVWLNFAADHLDRYSSMEEYHEAKLHVFDRQTGEDFAVVRSGEKLPRLVAQTRTFSGTERTADFTLQNGAICHDGRELLRMEETHLRGVHNAENLMAALGVGLVLGLSPERMKEPLCAYHAMPHRCEVVGNVNGVDYINDSKATNLDALEKALLGETRPVVLIAGGKDKGFEFGPITSLVASRARRAILIGEMAGRIARDWGGALRIERAATLADAVSQAHRLAQPGDVVLFSPGTSSFDMFRNYADRGNQFRQCVQNLAS